MGKPSLITGGCGFVGRHITRRICELGREAWLIDDLSIGIHPDQWLPACYKRDLSQQDPWRIYNGPNRVVFLQRDIRDFIEGRLPEGGPTIPAFGDVFHFAAVVGGRAMIENHPMKVAIDLALDSAFYNWAVNARPERILFASSSAAYPVSLQQKKRAVALKETDITFDGALRQPDMIYGWAKLTGEYLGHLAAKHYGLHVCSIRPFSGYGEDQDESYPIPAIAARAARQDNPFEVWGTGEQGRDFVHIDDCIDAMFIALDRIHDGSAVNIGSGELVSFREVIGIFTELAGYQAIIKPLLDKPVGAYSRYADMSYAAEVLDWRPAISIHDGFGRVLEQARQRVGGQQNTLADIYSRNWRVGTASSSPA